MITVIKFLNTSIISHRFFFLKMSFIYLKERDRDSEREHKWGGGGEAGFPLSGEPDTGLESRTLGS